jgi:hypothetical protein
VQRERCGLGCDVVLVDRDVFGEGPDAQVTGPCVYLVADFEVADTRTDLGHHSGDVVADHEGSLVLQELLELTIANHLVQRVDAGCTHSHQDVIVANFGFGYVRGPKAVLTVPSYDDCLHVCPPS